MIITSSTMAMASRQELSIRQTRRESLVMWQTRAGEGAKPSHRPAGGGGDRVSFSPHAHQAAPVAKTVDESLPVSNMDDLKMQLVMSMVEALTGHRIHIISPKDFLKSQEQAGQNAQETANGMAQQQQATNAPEGWGMIYQVQETRHEQESMIFAAAGKVTTADGRQIDISVQLGMSREFYQEKNAEVRAGDAARLTDPLVVNFGGTAAQLTDTKFHFDLDNNGSKEQISFVGGGSGLLALDKNKDGTINDGSELFGPTTGQGFAELAKHDQDGNQWIDENDAIYSSLRIWTKNSDGSDQLFALGQKGIGAIYLGNVGTEFSIKDSANNLQGQVRSTGVFLREDGSGGTVQQVDLVT